MQDPARHLEDTPRLGGTLLPFQRTGVLYARQKQRCFIGDEMGLGKTVQAIATVEADIDYPTLVVCPASLRLNWKHEYEKWVPHRSVNLLYVRLLPLFELQSPADIDIINYDILDKRMSYLIQRGYKSLIVDESHYLKSMETKRYRAMTKLCIIPHRYFLTGTAILNRPEELKPQLILLGRIEDFGGMHEFEMRYGGKWQPPSKLIKLNEKMRSLCYIRRSKSEVLTELPDKRRVFIPVDITNREEYETIQADIAKWFGEKSLKDKDFQAKLASQSEAIQVKMKLERQRSAEERAAAAEQLVKIEVLKQLSAKGKIKAVEEWIEDFLEQDEKLVVFCTHREIVKELSSHFHANFIDGETSYENRDLYVREFQTNPDVKILFLTIKTGGLGLTLTAASNSVFVELGWTPSEHNQAEDRLHRIGQKDSVTAWYFIGTNTIDEWIQDVLEKKRKVVDATLDGTGFKGKETSLFKVLVNKLSKMGEKLQ